jgi:ATP-dependent exoDNAse (exonuclease V) beta subunit
MRSQLREKLRRFRDLSGADLAPVLREELRSVADRYAELKRSHGVLDFLDLLLVARDLVRGHAQVRHELQRRFTHIFIDEFQDTDPLQAEILLLLAADDPAETDWRRVRPVPGKLFIVGDPKQSIYRFRRAGVALYQGVKRRLVEQGATLVWLTTSFRATPPLQAMVNAVFGQAMTQESDSQPAYAPLSPFRPDPSGQPPIVALPVPEPYNDGGRITQWAIDKSLPDAIASFIDWLIRESGWTVTERGQPEVRVPVEPRHVCVLFRRFNSHGRDVARPYVRALETRHLPHVLIKGSSFSEREEVMALRSALSAIERPDDELAVYATLRGPLFALGDDLLLEFRDTLGGLHPFRKLPADVPEQWREVEEALAVLRGLHRGRNRRPIAETLALLLAGVRAHAGFANWPTGEQALSNVMRLMEQGRRYEGRGGAVSFRGFVETLETQAEHEQASEVPVVEEGTAAIRVMSVHRAKGLEFPVVVLADLTCRETAGEPHRHLDPESGLCALRLAGHAPRDLLEHREYELEREREEAVRLLYVATTRARDLLVVPAVGDAPQPGWLQLLNSALYPVRASWRQPSERDVPGCPRFGTESVAARTLGVPSGVLSVTPGLHRSQLGEHRVVWWDPTVLKLNLQETTGIRQRKLLEADDGSGRSAESQQAYERWAAAKRAALDEASTPSIVVKAVTELAHEQAVVSAKRSDGALRVFVEQVPREPARPSGVRFGTLVHAIIRRISTLAKPDEIERMARLQGRILGAPASEIAAATEAVERALDSALMRRAAAAGSRLRRECPLAFTLEDGTLVEGIADLVFPENRDGRLAWTVVDFKTDVDLEARLEEYRCQLALYGHAVERSTGAPVQCAILAL